MLAHDLRNALARRCVEPRAGHHEVQMHARQQLALLVVEPEPVALRMQRLDAGKQPRIEQDVAAMRGQPRRQRALGLLQRRRRVRGRQVAEQRLDARQHPAAGIECRHRVVETRRLGAGGDRLDLGAVHRQRGVERRQEMLGSQVGERRQAELGGPGGKQRIGDRR